jgi:hypothetical protein
MNTPPSKPIRLTITVDPEVHAVFQRLAEVQGQSLGRVMGEWLGDTVEAAGHMASMVERAKTAPRKLARDLQGYALAMVGETGDLLERLQAGKPAPKRARGSADGAAAGGPPSSNTGGKVPSQSRKSGTGRP